MKRAIVLSILLALAIIAPAHAQSILTVNAGQVVTLSSPTTVAGVVVKEGGELRFDPAASVTLTSTGNVIISGTLTMQPANPTVTHRLHFAGVNETQFVGGGMVPLANDVGLWIVGAGHLQVAGSAKTAWTRAANSIAAGASSITLTTAPVGWQIGDTIAVVPSRSVGGGAAFYDTNFETRALDAINGTSITLKTPLTYAHPTNTDPQNGTVYGAEVLNLSRNVQIDGSGDGTASYTTNHRAHIFIHSTQPQTITYALLRYLAPRKSDGAGYTNGITGRYALHFHLMSDDSRGSLVKGIVARDIGSHVFVPHASHGITFEDDISYNTFDDAYWWDKPVNPDNGTPDPNDTNDLLITHSVAARVLSDPAFRGYTISGFVLGKGIGDEIVDSVAVGVQGNTNASGFVWPESGAGVWENSGNVSHNNKMDGVFDWQNSHLPLVVNDIALFNNGGAGIDHGAYGNEYQITDVHAWANGVTDVRSRAASNEITRPDGYGQAWVDLYAPKFAIAEHQLSSLSPILIKDCTIGHVTIDEQALPKAGKYDFVNCTKPDGTSLEAVDFTIISSYAGSHFRVQRLDGTAYQLNGDGTVAAIPAFYALLPTVTPTPTMTPMPTATATPTMTPTPTLTPTMTPVPLSELAQTVKWILDNYPHVRDELQSAGVIH